MCFFVNFSFHQSNNGSFPLQIPAFHFLLKFYSPRSCAHFSRRPLKFRSTIAINSRVTFVFRAAEFPRPQPEDSASEENFQGKERLQKQQGSSSSDTSSSEGKPPSLRSPSSSLTGNPLSSSANSASITFESTQIAAASSSLSSTSSSSSSSSYVQGSSCNIADVTPPPANPSSLKLKKLSHVSKGIKAAFGVLKGWKLIQKLHAPEGALLSGLGSAGNWVLMSVKATKVFTKGLKVSQKVLTSSPIGKIILKRQPDGAIVENFVLNDFASFVRGFNAFYAAIKIAQFSKSLGKKSQEGRLLDAHLLWKGYKFSKSVVSILDAVAGKNGLALTYMGKGFLIVKKGLGGVGVMVKAVFLSKELGPVVLKRLAISGGTFAAVLGARQQTSNRNTPVEVSQHSKSKKLLCPTLINDEGCLGDVAVVPFLDGSVKDESFNSLIHLFGTFIEDNESVHVKFCEEDDDLLPIFCLALPLTINEALGFS